MLIHKVKEYLALHGSQKLCNETGLSADVINAITEPTRRIKFKSTTLDVLYDFFRLYKDNFYHANLKKRYPKTQSMLWSYFRLKRMKKNLSLEQLAHKIKSSKLSIIRLELGESLPSFLSYTMQSVLKELEFNEEEIRIVKQMIIAVKDIENLLRLFTKGETPTPPHPKKK